MSKPSNVRNWMSTELVTLMPETEIQRAVRTLLDHDIAGAPVVDGTGKLVGTLSEQDCMRVALHAGYHSEHGGLVADYMSKDVVTIDAGDSVVDVAKLFFEEHFHRYPVLENNCLVGQISRRDVLRALAEHW